MKVGDEVVVKELEEVRKIVSSAYDDDGVEVFMVEGRSEDYYEKDLYLVDVNAAMRVLNKAKLEDVGEDTYYSTVVIMDRLIDLEEIALFSDNLVAKAGQLYAGFFLHIRQTMVEPKGKELGKTDKEITQMTIDSINVYLNENLDMKLADKYMSELDDEDDIAVTDETFEKFTKAADEVLNDEGDHIPRMD